MSETAVETDGGAKDERREPTFGIAELAEAFGVTARTIRYYEDQGLLTPIRKGNARIYTKRDRGRLALICRGKRLGFSLAEIAEFLNLYAVDPDQVEQMRFFLPRVQARVAALETQLADVQQTLGELRRIEGDIIDHLNSRGERDRTH